MEDFYFKMNAFHTLYIEVGHVVCIEKVEWDHIACTTVEDSFMSGRGAEVGAVLCGEGSLSSIRSRDQASRLLLIRHGGVLSGLATYVSCQAEDKHINS